MNNQYKKIDANTMKRFIYFSLLSIIFLSFTAQDRRNMVDIYMIGDSTMANKSLVGDNPERGWGQMLPSFFKSDRVCIHNFARNGRSTKSFINEGLWNEVVKQLKPGDYVFIEFGHNDEKLDSARHTDPGSTFDANLRRFISDTRAKGGIPVLFNAITRRHFQGGVLTDTHGAYRIVPQKIAKEMNVIYIDLNHATIDLVQNYGPEKSKELYVWVAPKTFAACPDGRQDNTHLNIYGARRVAGLVADSIEKKMPQLAPFIRHYDFVVAKDGSGDFFTVQEAINSIPDFRKHIRTTILVRKGLYKEKLVIPASKINVSLIGEDGAVISYDDYARKKNAFGDEIGTSGSASCYIYGSDFAAENITFENTSGPVGQAVACFISGDRAYFKHCRFKGFQDTLYNYGKNSRQYFENCYIEGTVDFIFGWSTAVFNHCQIHSLGNGYVTAPATDKNKKYGYVFYDCMLTAADSVDSVYLSRPWRPYARVVYINCYMGNQIMPQGWNNWEKKDAEKTVFYAEYQSKGAGANPNARVFWSHQLKSLKGYHPEQVLAGEDGWNPMRDGNKLIESTR